MEDCHFSVIASRSSRIARCNVLRACDTKYAQQARHPYCSRHPARNDGGVQCNGAGVAESNAHDCGFEGDLFGGGIRVRISPWDVA